MINWVKICIIVAVLCIIGIIIIRYLPDEKKENEKTYVNLEVPTEVAH